MKIAISIWQDRISPVFDKSQCLQIFMVNDEKVDSRLENIGERSALSKVEWLTELSIDVLICGAITRSLHFDLLAAEIEVWPFICGPTELILDDFLTHNKIDNRFFMPGYGRQNRRRNRRGPSGRGCRV
jgi:predicted Fe-Mo cluster-binding NifX family protein